MFKSNDTGVSTSFARSSLRLTLFLLAVAVIVIGYVIYKL